MKKSDSKFPSRQFSLESMPSRGFAFVKALHRLFRIKRPLACLKHYIVGTSPAYVDLRSGERIFFSSHPHDIRTFFVVFCKRDYGSIKKDSVVIDIGANVGVFSLYAAISGAKRVYAFEPSQEAFTTLCRNISLNGLEDIIIPFNEAVSETHQELVQFPRSSSPYNKIVDDTEANPIDLHEIRSVNLNSFVEQNEIDEISLLKMDCEGAEIKIIPSLNKAVLRLTKQIRMEWHDDPGQMIKYLSDAGFVVDRYERRDIWLTNRGNGR